jgi:hypothetical protein
MYHVEISLNYYPQKHFSEFRIPFIQHGTSPDAKGNLR